MAALVGRPLAARPAPVQIRSKRTLDRLIKATTELLQDRPLSDITVTDITSRARCSVGSFYARFASKDDLLPFIYERYDEQLQERLPALLRTAPERPATLVSVTAGLVSNMVDEYVRRRWLHREVALYARARPDAISTDVLIRRSQLHQLPLRLFVRFHDEIRHPDPDRAVLFAIFLVAAAARDKILFADAPHAAVTDVSLDGLKSELTHAFVAYLITPPIQELRPA
jgi:AcrR family transcriptional regulator